MVARLVFADLADCQETVAWVLGYFVTSWKITWITLATFYLREEVDGLVFATTKSDVFLVQEVLYPF